MENLVNKINPAFWKNKKVLLTGHTGFKGSWLSLILQTLGAEVLGYALAPITTPNLFTKAKIAKRMQSIFGDIRDLNTLQKVFFEFKPEIVIHMAAQPLVRYSYENPLETYQVNVLGTVNIFEAIRNLNTVKAIINVTSDKCYENKEWIWGYRETDAMGGFDPYSSSKGCAELITSSYQRSFFQAMEIGSASVRAGNVIGGGDWSDTRLIPDIIRALIANKNIKLRYPKAIRPWQHVLEPLNGYLILAERLFSEPLKFSGGWNFGPNNDAEKNVAWIANTLSSLWGNAKAWELESSEKLHEANNLKLDCSKAKTLLGWTPKWNLDHTLKMIIDWHRAEIEKQDMFEVSLQQIHTYLYTDNLQLLNNESE